MTAEIENNIIEIVDENGTINCKLKLFDKY